MANYNYFNMVNLLLTLLTFTFQAESQTMQRCLQDGVTTSVCNGTKVIKCCCRVFRFSELHKGINITFDIIVCS